MAALGDISRSTSGRMWTSSGSAPNLVGQFPGVMVSDLHRGFVGASQFIGARNPSHTATVTGVVGFDPIVLLQRGSAVMTARGDGAGNARFHDLDDGEYLASSSTYEQAWRIVVSGAGSSVVVTVLSGGGGTGDPEPSYAYVS